MNPTNEELFKQALLEGVNRHFERIVNSCDEDIHPSEEHKRIMQSILNGTYKDKNEN